MSIRIEEPELPSPPTLSSAFVDEVDLTADTRECLVRSLNLEIEHEILAPIIAGLLCIKG